MNIETDLLKQRRELGLTQIDAARIIGIPVRSYRRYESNNGYGNSIKRNAFLTLLNNACEITEDKGLLSLDKIKSKIGLLFDKEYKGQIEFCYLFGSYAKGKAKEDSDVDLYVSTKLTGIKFVGLIERIRQTLHKKIDLIRGSELENNIQLMNEILKDGIKVYG